MSKTYRPARQTRRPRPRRAFDRSIALARYRWEILRRTSEYRAAFRETSRSIAATLKCTEARLQQHCLENQGILERVFGDGFSSAEHYDKTCARFGLTVLMHPDVSFSDDDMADFPIFADAPRRQPVLVDRVLLRRAAMRGGDISRRTQRKIFAKKLVETGPFQPQVKRIHLDRLDTMLAVFDGHTAGKSLAWIAKDLRLSIDQVKRAWRVASAEIDRWSDFEAHLKECAQCQECLQRRSDRYCRVVERRIGLRSSGGVQLHATLEPDLDLLNARHQGEIPARRSFKSPSSSRD
jgi:hypothetical protein